MRPRPAGRRAGHRQAAPTRASVAAFAAAVAFAAAAAFVGLAACSSQGGSGAGTGADRTSVPTAATRRTTSTSRGSTRPPGPDAREDARYRVGMASFTFVDRSRPTAANGSYRGAPDRTIPTLVLYPARGEPGDAGTDAEDAPRAPGRFPLLVFSHGFTATGPDYRPLLREWARRGFVVAAPTFPLSNGDAPGGPVMVDVWNQPGDVSFVIDSLEDLSRRDPSWRGAIDPTRIAAAGHSLGAITTLLATYNTCCADRRIDAAVPISGLLLPKPGGEFFTGRPVPLLLVHGDDDRTVPYQGSVQAFERARPPKFLLTLEGAPHTPFVDPRWTDPVISVVADFLDAYLNHRPGSITSMAADADHDGATRLESDPGRRRASPGRSAARQPMSTARRDARISAASRASRHAVP